MPNVLAASPNDLIWYPVVVAMIRTRFTPVACPRAMVPRSSTNFRKGLGWVVAGTRQLRRHVNPNRRRERGLPETSPCAARADCFRLVALHFAVVHPLSGQDAAMATSATRDRNRRRPVQCRGCPAAAIHS